MRRRREGTSTSPVYAGIYQFIIVAMILAASGITGLLAILLMRAISGSAGRETLRHFRKI